MTVINAMTVMDAKYDDECYEGRAMKDNDLRQPKAQTRVQTSIF
jgi:hypothetical protein